MPSLGYTQFSIFFPEEMSGKPEEMSILALVVPHCRSNRDVPVLVGTNVLDVLYEIYTAYEETAVSNQVHCTNTPLIQTVDNRQQVREDRGKIGKVKLLSKKCVT